MKFKDAVTGAVMELELGTSRNVMVVGPFVSPLTNENGWCVVDGASWGYWVADIGGRSAGDLMRIEAGEEEWIVAGDLSEDDAELFHLAFSLSQQNGSNHEHACPKASVGKPFELAGGLR